LNPELPFIDQPRKPWVELEGKRLALHPVNAVANAQKKRPDRHPPRRDDKPAVPTDFAPNEVLVGYITGRMPHKEDRR